jgi:cell volume regulation protein A
MRYQYAGRLKENDIVYLFVAPAYLKLLDRLFASRVELEQDDEEFFGTFAIGTSRPAQEFDTAYGPGLLTAQEMEMTMGELVMARLGGQAEFADRIRIGPIVLIVRDLDENHRVSAIGISMAEVEPPKTPPLFLNLREILQRFRARARAS